MTPPLPAIPPERLSKEANEAGLLLCRGIRAVVDKAAREGEAWAIEFEAELAALAAEREREEEKEVA